MLRLNILKKQQKLD